jgi:hypothetical protein
MASVVRRPSSVAEDGSRLDCHNEQRVTDWIPAFAGMTIVPIGPSHPRIGGDPEKIQLQDILRLKCLTMSIAKV